MRRPRRVSIAVGVIALGAMACSTSNTADTSDTPRATPRTHPAPPTTTTRATTIATTTSTTVPPPPKTPVTLAFAGDVHFEGSLRSALAVDPANVFSGIAPVLRSYDIAMVNLETAITERGIPEPKQYTFRAPASALTALTAAGIDVATQANNHGVDYGPIGLADSLAARAQSPGVRVIGIGLNASDAYAPYEATIRGNRIAIVAATQVIDDQLIAAWSATDDRAGVASAKDVPRLLTAVRAARATNDTVVVFLHWGIEGAQCPTDAQRDLAAQLVAAGADVVVGSHSHQLEGAGFTSSSSSGRSLVDYGLGNFAFYTGTTSGVLTVTVTGRHVDRYGWVPARIVGGRPYPLTGAAGEQAIAAWQSLRSCTGLAP